MKNGLRILFLGDSITALGTTERGWIRYFNETVKPSFFVNLAVSGARLSNSATPVEFDGDPVFLGDKTDYTQNVVINQIVKLSRMRGKEENNCDAFDLILIAAGTNDWFCKEKCNIDAIEEQFTAEGKTIPPDQADCFTFPGAMRFITARLRSFYPDAVICFCSPIEGCESIRPYAEILSKRNLIKAVCERLRDVFFVDTFLCGIKGTFEKDGENGRDLIDGLHPNKNGAEKIGRFNAAAVLSLTDTGGVDL